MNDCAHILPAHWNNPHIRLGRHALTKPLWRHIVPLKAENDNIRLNGVHIDANALLAEGGEKRCEAARVRVVVDEAKSHGFEGQQARRGERARLPKTAAERFAKTTAARDERGAAE